MRGRSGILAIADGPRENVFPRSFSSLEGTLRTLAKALIALAAIAFVLAVVTAFTGQLMNVHPEGFSRACSNLALLAIALVLTFENTRVPSR